MPIVKMPDGQKVRFPDEMSSEQIQGFIYEKFPELQTKQRGLDKAIGVASTISHGATLGFGDKLGGAINGVGRVLASPITGENVKDAYIKGYNEIVDNADTARKQFAEENPLTATGLEIAGNIVGAGGTIAKQATKYGLQGMKRALATAGAENLGYGIADAENLEDIPSNIAKQEALGLGSTYALGKASTAIANKITPIGDRILKQVGVKDFSPRKFLNSLSDKDKAKKLSKAGGVGSNEIIEEARLLSDRFKLRKSGAPDEELDNLLKLPETKKAEESYSEFMLKNGSEKMPKSVVDSFYKENPIAKGLIKEMREVDPRAFDGISKGSLAELDMLKKILREEAGNKQKVGASRAGAFKRAEKNLKKLMDDEFEGFRKINKEYASAMNKQKLYDTKIERNINSLANTTKKDFFDGFTGSLSGASLFSGLVNPYWLGVTGAALSGKGAVRSFQKRAGENLAYDIVKPELRDGINDLISFIGSTKSSQYLQSLNDYLKQK